jgi:uncharacterized protein (TIGR03437 family)
MPDLFPGIRRAVSPVRLMRSGKGLRLVLVAAASSIGLAQNQPFLLGLDYSKAIGAATPTAMSPLAVASDGAGDIYILSAVAPAPPYATLLKLAPDGSRLISQTPVALTTDILLAVDPAGNVYLAGYTAGSQFVEKLDPSGQMVYQVAFAESVGAVAIAADDSGRLYVGGTVPAGAIQTTSGAFQTSSVSGNSHGFIERFTPSGAVDYATYLGGSGSDGIIQIAVDNSGSAFVAGTTGSPDFPITPGAYLATPPADGMPQTFVSRLNTDGSALIYSTFADTQFYNVLGLAVDPADNAVLALPASNQLDTGILRLSSSGRLVFSQSTPGAQFTGLGVDASGHTYLTFLANGGFTIKNSLLPCGNASTAVLTVLDDQGNILQSTYVPGNVDVENVTAMTVSPQSTVDLVALPETGRPPEPGDSVLLTQLSPNADAQTVQLICEGNSASYDSGAISPGEIVSLFGSGLGPADGVKSQPANGNFPAQLANVTVTFDGTPGPMLYAQDSQVNAIAPWSLQIGKLIEICVANNGIMTNCIERSVAQTHAGVFTVDGTHAAALNQDGTLNSPDNPAQPNSIVTIFGTGFGPIAPPLPDGSIIGFPLPENTVPFDMYVPPFISPLGVGSPTTIQVTYAGPAPEEVAGVTQIDFAAVPYGVVSAGNALVPVYVYMPK